MSSEVAPASPGPRRAALAFIFITVALDVLAMGIIIPVLPKLVESFVGGDTAKAARLFGVFGTVWALMQFIASPVLGGLSDRFGRRPVILLSSFGLGLDYVFMALAPSLAWLFVGRVISGITSASFTTAYSYIADITPPERRAATFGLVGAAFGAGFVLGPAVGGLLGASDPRLPFWVAGAMALINTLYGCFVLPESLPRERRRPFDWRRANPLGSIALFRSRPGLLKLASVYSLHVLAHNVLPSTFVLYAGHRYGWDARQVGLMLALVGVCSIVMQALVVRPFVARFGERIALVTAISGAILGYALYGLAPNGTALLLSVPVFALSFLFMPAMQGLMSRSIDASQQGELQGANGSLMGITGVIGPTLFTQTFAFFIRDGIRTPFPGAPFHLAAGLMVLAFGLAWTAMRGRGDWNPEPAGPEPR